MNIHVYKMNENMKMNKGTKYKNDFIYNQVTSQALTYRSVFEWLIQIFEVGKSQLWVGNLVRKCEKCVAVGKVGTDVCVWERTSRSANLVANKCSIHVHVHHITCKKIKNRFLNKYVVIYTVHFFLFFGYKHIL